MISTAFGTIISLCRHHSWFIFLWLHHHTSTRRMVSGTGWGKVSIWLWSSFCINSDNVYASRSTSQCWHVTPCQNTGGARRGQPFFSCEFDPSVFLGKVGFLPHKYLFILTCPVGEGSGNSLANRPRSIYQYSSMAPRLSGQTSIFGVVFFVSKSLLGIERQKKL